MPRLIYTEDPETKIIVSMLVSNFRLLSFNISLRLQLVNFVWKYINSTVYLNQVPIYQLGKK